MKDGAPTIKTATQEDIRYALAGEPVRKKMREVVEVMLARECKGCKKRLTNATSRRTGYCNHACHIERLQRIIAKQEQLATEQEKVISELERELKTLRNVTT